LESHPFSAQTFLPLDMSPSIAVVCLRDADGKPDLSTLEAFIVQPDQIVTYKRNTLHHKLTPLSVPASFAMSMSQTGCGGDTIFHDLPVLVEIEWSFTG
jgi:ureidoglycolate lyase